MSFREAVVALLVFGMVGPVAAQTAEPLFSDADAPGLSAPAADARPFVVRSRTAALQLVALQRALASPAADGFTLNLFEDATFAVTFERVEDSGVGPQTWTGHLSGSPLSTVSLTMNGDAVTGMVTDDSRLFEISSAGGGAHRITEMDTSLMPLERDIVVPPGGGDRGGAEAAAPALSQPALSTIDVLVYYSAALTAQYGSAGISSIIAQYISNTNTAYARSGIAGQLRLVGAQEVPAVIERADPSWVLGTLATHPMVRSQRDAAGADLVALLVQAFSSAGGNSITCGVGYLGSPGSNNASFAFTATASRSECVHTFAHEVGHNLGAQHADEDGVQPPSTDFPGYARAYKAPNHAFRTVMAYACRTPPTCPRVLNFSNPNVLEGGQPTGTTGARNAQRMNELIAQVAGYRSAVSLPPAPSPPQNLQAFTNGLNVTLQWQPSPGGAANYVVAAGTAPGQSNLGHASVGLVNTVSASLPRGTYYARVYAQNAGATSAASNEVTINAACTPPSAPQNFRFDKSGFNLVLSWSPPTAGGPTFTYRLQAGTIAGAANLFDGSVGSRTSLGGTVPAGAYFVRVIATNACGAGPASAELSIPVP